MTINPCNQVAMIKPDTLGSLFTLRAAAKNCHPRNLGKNAIHRRGADDYPSTWVASSVGHWRFIGGRFREAVSDSGCLMFTVE